MENLTKKELRELLIKISHYIAKKLMQIKEQQTYTDSEIGRMCDIYVSRITELRYFMQPRINSNGEPTMYTHPVFLNQLERMVAGGFLSVNELKDNVDLTPKEENFINNLIIFEDDLLRMAASELKRRGYEPGKMLFELFKDIKESSETV